MQLPPTTDAPAAPARRTQQQRREKTRTAVLEATVECLVELGYGASTTLEVERRAGVSRGARIHHFPSKALLLASAVDYLYSQLGDHYEQAFGHARAGASDAERFCSGLQLLWRVYQRPGYAAVLELSMAARTDDELRARLQEVGDRHRALAIDAAGKYFPSLAPGLAWPLVESIQATLLGLIMQRNVVDDPARDQAVLRMTEALAVSCLSGTFLDPHAQVHASSTIKRPIC
jgi:AcrR family transcriptional regulator